VHQEDVEQCETMLEDDANQDSLYAQAAEAYGAALDRLARAYELDAEARRDLLQEIHLHLWRSLSMFDQKCSLRTWVYRVAHNVAAGHVIRQRRIRERLLNLEDLDSVEESIEGSVQTELAIAQGEALERLSELIQRLKPLDRQIIVSYLEDMPASAIAEITGLSPANVAMKIHRIKKVLKRWFGETSLDEGSFGERGTKNEQ
jgi:RNA polymerase sigma-70 factor, ECF subfamily